MAIEEDDPADPDDDDDYDALARQRVRALGLELADYGTQGIDPYAEDEEGYVHLGVKSFLVVANLSNIPLFYAHFRAFPPCFVI